MMMLHRLAQEAGIARQWQDADSIDRIVSDDSLRAILAALGLPAGSNTEIAASRQVLAHRRSRLPHMITADRDTPIAIPDTILDCQLFAEDGAPLDISVAALRTSGLSEPGYYRLGVEDASIALAIAPDRCPALSGRCWGVAIQIPSLRGAGDFGDFDALADAVGRLGRAGADAVAISPVHALNADDPARFAPYSPFSRLDMNGLFGTAPPSSSPAHGDLIDWAVAGPAKMAALRGAGGEEADFARFLQTNARDAFDRVQQAARDAGMAIGLVTDLAVGVDPAGFEAQGDPSAFLQGLRIGAPPDPLGPQGQDWGLTSYSPQGLADRAFAPFIAMLRANIPAGGGIRIDHAFGLQRLWVVPEGLAASDGAYLAYPFADLLRLVKLEAWRAHAVVIAEDLGTLPPGFREALDEAGIYGMAVLPFSRDEHGAFLPADAYPAGAVAMSGTHDVPTIAGWWTGRDLEWNAELGRGGDSAERRDEDRAALWDAIGDGKPLPGTDQPAIVVDAALAFLARTPSPLVIIPMEDLIGAREQPNLPGTIDEHPNWRRRLPEPVEALLAREDVAHRIAALNQERHA